MKPVSRKDLFLLALILTGFLIYAVPRWILPSKGGMFETQKEKLYYCPMHPTYISDRAGDCPICNMKLVPKPGGPAKKGRKILYYRHPMGQPDTSPAPKKDSMGMDYIPVYEDEAGGVASQVTGRATIQIPLEKQQLIGVKLGAVEKRPLTKEIRTVGRVAYDPDLYTAQQEFLSAVDSLKKAEKGPYHEPLERTQALLESTKVRLRLLGMSEAEISELEKNAVHDQNLILPTEFVWVYGTIYEYELPFVKIGTPVKIHAPTFPEKEFQGEVRALDPVLDSATRSIRVRARVENPEGLLKPEMYVNLYFKTGLGEALTIPEEAVLHTGEQTLVFVAQGEGYFEPRKVILGTKVGNFYEVKEGLRAGEPIVVSGNFLIDSESRLQGALAGMSGGGHQHGA